MGQTLVEKIISKNIGRPVRAGETVVVNVDFAALHDGSGDMLGIRCLTPLKSCLPTSLGQNQQEKLPMNTHCAENLQRITAVSGKKAVPDMSTLMCTSSS